mgnify:CR=1 FL=1
MILSTCSPVSGIYKISVRLQVERTRALLILDFLNKDKYDYIFEREGIPTDKKIFGLEQDYESFKKDKDRDGFGKFFDSMIKDYFGDSFSSTLLEKEFLKKE